MPTQTIQTPIGNLDVTLVTPTSLVVATPYENGEYDPNVINGVEYTVRYSFERGPAFEYGYGPDKTWRIDNNYGKLQRNGWQNWNKPVSDSAHRKAREAVNLAIITFGPDLQTNAAAVEDAQRNVDRIESEITTAQRKMDELLIERLEALAALYTAEQEREDVAFAGLPGSAR